MTDATTPAGHMPGPWIATDRCGHHEILAPCAGSDWYGIRNMHAVAYVDTEVPEDEALPTAQLIAAAPDLLEVLTEAVTLYGKQGGPWNVPSDPGGWLDRARAAITRATGRAGE